MWLISCFLLLINRMGFYEFLVRNFVSKMLNTIKYKHLEIRWRSCGHHCHHQNSSRSQSAARWGTWLGILSIINNVAAAASTHRASEPLWGTSKIHGGFYEQLKEGRYYGKMLLKSDFMELGAGRRWHNGAAITAERSQTRDVKSEAGMAMW